MRRLLPLLLLAGCTPAEPAAVVGTGEFEWEDIEDGRMPVIFGSQGGYHLNGSIRVMGVEAGDADDLWNENNPTIRFDVVHDGESILVGRPFTQGMEPTPAGTEGGWTHQIVGRRAILTIGDDAELDGEIVEFTMEVTDVHGVVVGETLEIECFPHPLND